MSSPTPAAQGCSLAVTVFDGARQPMPASVEVLYTVRDGNQKNVFRDYRRMPLVLTGLPFHNNLGDNYAVIAWAEGHVQAGFYPVKVSPNVVQQVDLMLLKKDAAPHFGGATWETVQAKRPVLGRLLLSDVAAETAARDRYRDLIENKPEPLACLLNIATAMEQINLRTGSPLDHLRQLIWDETMKCDRFFAYAEPALLDQVREAARLGLFEPEPGSSIFHPGATASYKQVQFGEANVQITFHEEDRRTIDGHDCLKVELDIDYYKDLGAHALLEVIHNTASGSLTDPRQVYLLRWMAGRRAGVPEFDPLYTIV
jgi:hypothetical protein